MNTQTHKTVSERSPWADGTLDPADWETFARDAHRMLDDALNYLHHLRERPVWQPVPRSVKESIGNDPLPIDGMPLSEVYEEFRENILPYPTGNIHPRFWGWVMGSGTPVSMLADMLAATMNPHVAGYEQAAPLVERRVISWLAQLFGFPDASSGLLVSGGTSANLHGLTIARNTNTSFDVRQNGIRGIPPLKVYASTETHSWLQRSCELLGLGRAGLRKIQVGDRYEIDIDALRSAIREDREKGEVPFCIVANAGTVNTGATDDLNALADVAKEEGLWLHVDGAFGAMAKFSQRYAHLVRGIERADSVAFDLHKWPSMTFEIGGVLFREDSAAYDSFATAPSYLRPLGGGIAAEPMWFADRGIQLTRGFRALKAWFSIKTFGMEVLARSIERNIDQAQFVADYARNHRDLELLAPVPMNVVNLRFVKDGLSNEVLNELNRKILIQLQSDGTAVPSSTMLHGRFALRLAITNHRTLTEDLTTFLDETVKLGNDLVRADT